MSKSPMEKLAGIRIELAMLAPRLPDSYRKNLETCVQWCNDLEEHLTIIDDDDDDDES